MIEEPESTALAAYLADAELLPLATSRVALVEVPRATSIASPTDAVRERTEHLLRSCHLVNVSDGVLRAAARLASLEMRTLEAIHLASATRIDADEMVVYDRRLREAALAAGLSVSHPGAAA